MDSIPLLALAVIAAVPAVFVAARIFRYPITGLCLWVLLLPVTRTMANLAGYPPGEGPIVLQKLTLGDPVLLLTLAGLLSGNRSAGPTYDRQGRRIVWLLAAFCVASVASATLGETGPESLIELATYSWLCLALVVICQLLSSPDRVRRVLTAWRRAGVIGCVAGGVGTLLLWRGSMDNLLVQGGRVAGLFEGINELPYGIRRSFSYVQEDTLELDELSIGRADQLRTFYTVFAEHPLVGVGPGGFAAWVPRVVPGGKAQEMHNSYLGVLGETGAIGGLIMLALLADAMARTLRFLWWASRVRDADALMAARALFVSYASILMYGMLNYGLRQRHFWFVIALTVALPHVYGQWRARARVDARRTRPLYGVVPCVESQA